MKRSATTQALEIGYPNTEPDSQVSDLTSQAREAVTISVQTPKKLVYTRKTEIAARHRYTKSEVPSSTHSRSTQPGVPAS